MADASKYFFNESQKANMKDRFGQLDMSEVSLALVGELTGLACLAIFYDS